MSKAKKTKKAKKRAVRRPARRRNSARTSTRYVVVKGRRKNPMFGPAAKAIAAKTAAWLRSHFPGQVFNVISAKGRGK